MERGPRDNNDEDEEQYTSDIPQKENTPVHSRLYPIEQTLRYFKEKFIKKTCERCEENSWFVLRTADDKSALPSVIEPALKADSGHGYTVYTRICLSCGNVQLYSQAIVNAEIRDMLKEDE